MFLCKFGFCTCDAALIECGLVIVMMLLCYIGSRCSRPFSITVHPQTDLLPLKREEKHREALASTSNA